MDRQIRVLLLEGHQGVREALALRLRHAHGIHSVATATTLDAAVQAVRDHIAHVVLYDPRTVAGDGAEAVQRLKQVGGQVIVLTSSHLQDEAAALRRAGAAALVLKGTAFSTLLTLVETLVSDPAPHSTLSMSCVPAQHCPSRASALSHPVDVALNA